MSKLGELRKAAGLSQSQLAKASGIGVRMIQSYEQGAADFGGIGLRRAKAIADALGITLDELAHIAEEKHDERTY